MSRRVALATAAAGLAITFAGCATKRVPVGFAPPMGYTSVGIASWYGPGFHGRKTSNGERFDQDELTAAHRLWAFGTRVRVTHLRNGRSVMVRINDRLPRKDRVIDLSRGAAREIGLIGPGTGRVRLEVVEQATRANRRRTPSPPASVTAVARVGKPRPVTVTAANR